MRIKLALYKGQGDIFDKLIRWWTRSKYSHTELVINSLWYSSSPRDLKVRVMEMQPYNRNNWDFVDIEVTNEQVSRMVSFAQSQMGKKYDWLGIALSQVLPLNVDNPKRWFCSELCSEMLIQGGVIVSSKPSNWYSPERLYSHLRNMVLDAMAGRR